MYYTPKIVDLISNNLVILHLLLSPINTLININTKSAVFYHSNLTLWISKMNVPNSFFSLSTRAMHLLHPLHGFAYATALPIKRCHACIPSLSPPFAIYFKLITTSIKTTIISFIS